MYIHTHTHIYSHPDRVEVRHADLTLHFESSDLRSRGWAQREL